MGAKLGTYDGSTNLDIYLAKFRNCAEYFEWNSKDQLFQLKHSLEGAAALVVHEIGRDCTLDELISVLIVRFGYAAFFREIPRGDAGSPPTSERVTTVIVSRPVQTEIVSFRYRTVERIF